MASTKTEEQEKLKALKDFEKDISCLGELSKWTDSFNLFEVLKIVKAEIRHSNILAWLMTPNEKHGLGDSILRGFVEYAAQYTDDTLDVSAINYDDFIVLRERNNIDLLAISESNKLVLCIENKVDAKESNGQLNKYQKTVDDEYPDYCKLYLFLTPDGRRSSNPDVWHNISYEYVLEILEAVTSKKRYSQHPEAELLIENYKEIIRRHVIMNDTELYQKCNEIYKANRAALDLIFENKIDKAKAVAKVFCEWAEDRAKKGQIIFDKQYCTPTYTRFKTAAMSEILPDCPENLSDWKSPNYYFYEIKNEGGEKFVVQLAFNRNNKISQEIADTYKLFEDHANNGKKIGISKRGSQKTNWQWWIAYKATSRGKGTIADDVADKLLEGEEMRVSAEESIFNQLDTYLKKIKNFEEKLKNIAQIED